MEEDYHKIGELEKAYKDLEIIFHFYKAVARIRSNLLFLNLGEKISREYS